jgi:hypothetical protein
MMIIRKRFILLSTLIVNPVQSFLSQELACGVDPDFRRPNRAFAFALRETKNEISRDKKQADLRVLKELENCRTGTAARRVLKQAFDGTNALYNSVVIPAGASDRGITDGDLAIQTKIRNKKYGVFDLIDLNGDRDADRASAGVLGVFVASSLSAIVANEKLPGPEIIRFLVVWIFSFAPLALVGYGIATPDNLQTLLVSLQRNIFPSYRKRMIQHEAGEIGRLE